MSETKSSTPESIKSIEHLETRIREDILHQFESQATILKLAGILTESETEPGRLSFKDIEGIECFLPSQAELFEYLEEEILNNPEKHELITKKYEQGFTKFQITPFGMKLDDLIEHYKAALANQPEGQLYTAKKNPDDPTEELVALDLNRDNPIYVWNEYKDADTKGTLVYYPEEFSKKHNGKTKKEILKEQRETKKQQPLTFPGFELKLLPKNPNILRQNPMTVLGRTEMTTDGSSITQYIQEGQEIPNPKEYLKAMQQDPMYQGEEGMTPEDWFVLAITNLKEHNHVIDDYQGNSSIAYQLGAYFPASGYVSGACWSRDDRRASVFRRAADGRVDVCGVRPSVRI